MLSGLSFLFPRQSGDGRSPGGGSFFGGEARGVSSVTWPLGRRAEAGVSLHLSYIDVKCPKRLEKKMKNLHFPVRGMKTGSREEVKPLYSAGKARKIRGLQFFASFAVLIGGVVLGFSVSGSGRRIGLTYCTFFTADGYELAKKGFSGDNFGFRGCGGRGESLLPALESMFSRPGRGLGRAGWKRD